MSKKSSLTRRFFALSAALGVATLASVAVVSLIAQYRVELDHLHDDAALIVGAIAAETPSDSALVPSDLLDARLQTFSASPRIDLVCLYGDAGVLIASHTVAANRLCPLTSDQSATGAWSRSQRDVVVQGQSVGTLILYSLRDSVIARMTETLPALATIVALMLVLVLAASYRLAQSATLPIRRLTESAAEFEIDRPTLRLDSSGIRELNRLSVTFNRVLDRLVVSREEAKKQLEQLERAQRAEETARLQTKALVDLLPYPVFAVKANGELAFANPALANLYGTTVQDLTQGSIADLAIPRDGLLYTNHDAPCDGEEVWFTDLHAESRRFLVSRVPFSDGTDRLVIAVDVTEEHRLQVQLQFAQRLEVVGTLAGGIAHDFNNLLTPILGYTTMLLEQGLGDPVDDKLRAMELAARKARDVVLQILTFSRQQQREPEKKIVDVAAVIHEAVVLMRATIPSNTEIETEVDEDLYPVWADASQLSQVVMNLCTNSAQSIQVRGRIALRAFNVEGDELLEPNVCIEVSDDGEGMTEDVVNHIFEPFFTTKNVGEGSGLGLSVVHGIVSSHGGSITAESVLGIGSTFRVVLPADPADMASGEHPIVVQTGGGERIMLVDDELPVLAVTGDLLRHFGYQVTSLSDPLEALRELQSGADCDVLITDNSMPTLTGLELATEIRNTRPDLPVILMTGFINPESMHAGPSATQREIQKPISGRELSALIQEVLRERTFTPARVAHR